MQFRSLKAAIVTLAVGLLHAHSVAAICNSGELALGVTAQYGYIGWQEEGELSQNPEFYDSNCNTVAVSDANGSGNVCDGSYGSGAGIQCDGNGTPTFVWTPEGNYHNCYQISNAYCEEGPYTYIDVYWCCQYWA